MILRFMELIFRLMSWNRIMYRKSRLRCDLLLYLKLAVTYSKVHSADEELNIEKRCGESDSLRLFILSLEGVEANDIVHTYS